MCFAVARMLSGQQRGHSNFHRACFCVCVWSVFLDAARHPEVADTWGVGRTRTRPSPCSPCSIPPMALSLSRTALISMAVLQVFHEWSIPLPYTPITFFSIETSAFLAVGAEGTPWLHDFTNCSSTNNADLINLLAPSYAYTIHW
jgi:hypothetical protein